MSWLLIYHRLSQGIDCEGTGLTIDYNNLWNSIGGEHYVGLTLTGSNDISTYPSFAANNDFHLLSGSLCLDAGDPVETLTGDYTAGSTLTVNETTNLSIDDRIWVTDGSSVETDIITGFAATSVDISGQFMNSSPLMGISYSQIYPMHQRNRMLPSSGLIWVRTVILKKQVQKRYFALGISMVTAMCKVLTLL